ncbi:TetR/AcrR family transcriptional regulator [Amycolatopsis sp. K13G38]|uniref:TetR/AcrR family transcriptional regulator n=1 Tax=Amycolatopsis acididurans TaxID=2724524 RepID=A0ABX1IWH3_9PSEU|nr:TetR/AcrR family transcriptional regulator [Amycolatopsis acididurans]NKQ51846.1 TetR/AcrR family transcriptional regulator [Amycolatopsis acididurans]
MATLREAQKEMTRKLLLDAGLDLFVSKGYATTKVDDIATAAGTTRVTFYAYFPSKVDLMKALISERLNAELDRVPSAAHGSTADELVAVVEDGSRKRIRAWLAAISQRWDAIRPYTTAAFEAAAVDPEIRELLDTWLNEAIGDVKDGLDRAGRFPASTRHFRSVIAITELDHVARHWTPGHWGVDREEMLDVLTESWVGSIGRR